MQILRANPYPSLPLAQEPPRERSTAEFSTQLVQTQGLASRQATRAIEEIRTAEQILDRRRSQTADGYMAQEGRQQRKHSHGKGNQKYFQEEERLRQAL